jgi:hypothetical protein
MGNRPRGRLIICLAALASLLPGCVPRQPPEPPRQPAPPPPRVLYEEDLKPVERPQILITDVNETLSEDRRTAIVNGTLVNRGNGATHELAITVWGLDKVGAEVAQRQAVPSTQRIPPGGTATFTANFERRPEIDHYHVEAVSR